MHHEQLRKLISSWCDGAITSEEFRLLEKELCVSAESRSIYVDYLEHEASLEWELASKKSVEDIQAAEAEEWLALASSVGLQFESAKPHETSRSSYRLHFGLIAAAILVAVGLASWRVDSDQLASRNKRYADSQHVDLVEDVGSVEPLTSNCLWYVEARPLMDDNNVSVGDTLRVVEGEAKLTYHKGATVMLAAPAIFEVTSPNAARLVQGKLRGKVPEGAEGFVVDTPRATVVDYGTEFGVSVEPTGATDVAVFEGEVGIEGSDAQNSLRLRMGDGVHLDKYGTMSRLVAFESRHFPLDEGAPTPVREPVITGMRDNCNRAGHMRFYEIVVGGMREDACAYVDRIAHQWNGQTSAGMPDYLLGADYVRMFNDDKMDARIEIEVIIDRPSILYVLVDDRNAIPEWLGNSFEDTGDDIGLDSAPFTSPNGYVVQPEKTTGVGPGVSIDAVFSIWQKTVAKPCTLRLGSAEPPNDRTNMYALAAVPLE